MAFRPNSTHLYVEYELWRILIIKHLFLYIILRFRLYTSVSSVDPPTGSFRVKKLHEKRHQRITGGHIIEVDFPIDMNSWIKHEESETINTIFIVRMIQERAIKMDIYLCFIDYRRAFDSVWGKDIFELWGKLYLENTLKIWNISREKMATKGVEQVEKNLDKDDSSPKIYLIFRASLY